MNLVNKFGGGNCGKNGVRTSTLTKRPTKADYLFSNHVNHNVSNFVSNPAKNATNYLIPYAKKSFNQLRQAFTEVPILQYFDPE